MTALSTETGCRIQAAGSGHEVPLERIAALAFSTQLLARARPRQPFAHVVLAGGGRLSLTTAAVAADPQQLTATTIFRAAVTIPLCQMVALEMRQGRAVYLSDLEPSRYEHTPFLGLTWPCVRDGSVAGLALALRDRGVLDKGLGMHSGSRITYDLQGEYEWFEAWVGMDPQTGAKGSARIKVLVDGVEQDLGRDRELTAQGAALTLRIPVHRAKRLTLRADYGPRGDVQGHVTWGNARLIRKRS